MNSDEDINQKAGILVVNGDVLIDLVISSELQMFFTSSVFYLNNCQEKSLSFRKEIIVCETLHERLSSSNKVKVGIRIIDVRQMAGFEGAGAEYESFGFKDISDVFKHIIPDLIEKINKYNQEENQKFYVRSMIELQSIYKLYKFRNFINDHNLGFENFLVVFQIPRAFGQW